MRLRLRLKRKVKVVLYIIFILAIAGAMAYTFYYGKNNVKKKSITYSKESSINYVTYLKDNNHFADQFLKDNYNYVASLIDYFNLDFNYSYVLGEAIKYDLDYLFIAVYEDLWNQKTEEYNNNVAKGIKYKKIEEPKNDKESKILDDVFSINKVKIK